MIFSVILQGKPPVNSNSYVMRKNGHESKTLPHSPPPPPPPPPYKIRKRGKEPLIIYLTMQ